MRPVPKTCPNVDRKPPLPMYGRQFRQIVQPQFVNALISQPLVLITSWHLPCFSYRVVRKLVIRSFNSIACAKNKGWSTMKGASARQTSFDSRHSFPPLRALIVMLVYWGCLFAPTLSHAAELKQKTVVSWNAYLDTARPL